ncbi:hypothetical protein MKX01_042058 [Papaver californicum]|nr:hypothetical protein MKX01_042058 [Papaver californicum]
MKKMSATFLFLYLIFSCLFIRISVVYIMKTTCDDRPSVRENNGGFGHKYNHANDNKIPIHRSGGFGQKYNHTNNNKIIVHSSNSANTVTSTNCTIQSSNSTSTSTSSNTGSIMINHHKGTSAFTLFVTLTAIFLVIY